MKRLITLSTALVMSVRADVAVTIFNQNLAVVRDSVPLDLVEGENEVTYDRATSQVIPDSVVLRDPTGKMDFLIYEQSYRNDPVSQSLLLSLFEGQSIPFEKTHRDGKIEMIEGKVIRSGHVPGSTRKGPSPVIETDGGIQFSLPGKPRFPSLGNDSILKPTLSWTLGATEAVAGDAQLSYLSRGLSWEASYNLVAPEEGEQVTLSGWITANNNSGTTFEEAKLKLVAGDVNLTSPQAVHSMKMAARNEDAFAAAPEPKAFDGFHLYTLPRPVTLRNQETKQVEFLRSPAVETEKLYIYEPVQMRFSGGRSTHSYQQQFSKDVAIFWTFKNSEENGLGVPMPAGTVRFYREDSSDGNLEFVGENRIDHTPNNEELKVYTGNAFDLVGERKVTNFEHNERGNWMKETIEVTLKNRSKKPQTIVARERLWRWSNWKLETESVFEKTDSNTIEFTVDLAPDEVKVVTYVVTYSW